MKWVEMYIIRMISNTFEIKCHREIDKWNEMFGGDSGVKVKNQTNAIAIKKNTE